MKKIGKYYYDINTHKVYLNNINNELIVDKQYKVIDSIATVKKCRRVVIVLSNNCNLGCKYCYASQGNYNKDTFNNLTRQKCDEMVNYLVRTFPEGIKQIQFFGGEPLLEYEAMKYLCARLSDKLSFIPQFTLVTNGTILNDYIIDIFKQYNFTITVSLDVIERSHNMNRYFKNSLDGSYQKIVSNILKLKSYNFDLVLQITIDKYLIKMLEEDYQLIINTFINNLLNIGVLRVHMAPVMANKNSALDMNSHEITILNKFYKDVLVLFEKNKIIETSKPHMLEFMKHKLCNEKYCGAGRDEITIDLDGIIYPCFLFINTPYAIGNINDGIIVNNRLQEIEGALKSNNYKCQKCFIKDNCSMCIGANYIRNNDIKENSNIYCTFKKTAFTTNLKLLLNKLDQNNEL